jgi:hypothetical protein
MNIGMLWYDNDPKVTLNIKVQRAADYYQSKYGKAPDRCFVHPDMIPVGERPVISGLVVVASKQVLRNHLWIGFEGQNA